MKVKELIKILEKMPKNFDVYMADHDHGRFETNSLVGECSFIDKNEMDEYDNDDDSGLSDTYKYTPNKYVVIRP